MKAPPTHRSDAGLVVSAIDCNSAKHGRVLPSSLGSLGVRRRNLPWEIHCFLSSLTLPTRRIGPNNRCPPASVLEAFAPMVRLVLCQLGASDGSRTRDRQVHNLMLYPLSYFNRYRFRTRSQYTWSQLLCRRGHALPDHIDQTLACKQECSDSNTVHRFWRPSPLPGEHSCMNSGKL